jgi:serine/threonine-protein kinase RsbW
MDEIKKTQIQLKNELSDLAKITDELTFFFAKKYEFLINPINLILEELYSNSINYGKCKAVQININLDIKLNLLTIIYEDNGTPFNPLSVQTNIDSSVSVQESKIGGLGIHLVKNMTDAQHYKRYDNKNQLTLEKKLTQKANNHA